MIRAIRVVLLVQTIIFMAAALTHFGVLMRGLEHGKAGIAEGVIGAVLLAGLIVTFLFSALTRAAGIAVQAFAFFGLPSESSP